MPGTPQFALGLDYGTQSVRALVVDTATGEEIAVGTADYASGRHGIVDDEREPDLARQQPADWQQGFWQAAGEALTAARRHPAFRPERLVGIGVDTTGSTPLPVDAALEPLAARPEFAREPAALAWLWKDHTAHAEAAELTASAQAAGRPFLRTCGGTYSSEWYWSKLLRAARTAPRVVAAAATWLEACDWIPAWLCGLRDAANVPRSVCAAGHKALWHPSWGGPPDAAFLAALHPELARVRAGWNGPVQPSNRRAGTLRADFAARLGLPAGIPVATGALDAHAGAVGSGVGPGTLVKILGTSTCDCMVAPLAQELPVVPGLCGIVPESIVPGMHGLEAGQSAVGDIFQWFVERIAPGGFGTGAAAHQALLQAAAAVAPGRSGLLALDWHNGNRCVLTDPRLTGLVLGLTLATTPAELHRAWLEATAFGARRILDRLQEYGVGVERIVTCGGLAEKSPLLLQIHADVCERPLLLARSAQACALGAAVYGAVAAGAHADVPAAQAAMTGQQATVYRPQPAAVAVYRRLYALWQRVHDAFGRPGAHDLSSVMKDLLVIRDAARV